MLSVVQILQQPCDRGELRPTTPQVSEGGDEESVHDHRAGSQGPRAHILISTSNGSRELSLSFAEPLLPFPGVSHHTGVTAQEERDNGTMN